MEERQEIEGGSTRKSSYYCNTPVYLLKTYHKDRSINRIKYVVLTTRTVSIRMRIY